ncbi:CgeB family protein [Peribacillus sp. NPDC097675]|uniref:CgeB family protein n=1 Tax=Peribacillus sp. NPDC097675 TaxID=3390618 RepID=UPI003D0759E1
MKILMISSGYKGIYPHFEQAIEKALRSSGHYIRTIKPACEQEIMGAIREFHPDFIITLVGFMVNGTLMECLKKSGLILCIWLTEDPFYMDKTIEMVKDYHYVFTVDVGAFEHYRKKFPDKKIFFLPLGTDPFLYRPSNNTVQYSYDVCIVGYPYPDRVELANDILNKTPYRLILVGPRWKKHMANQPKERVDIINRWVAPETVRNLFTTSKIILNPHRAFDFEKNSNSIGIINKSINNKTFDIAASGSFQLISNQTDIKKHFHPDEIVSYRDHTDCLDLINYYIDKESERSQYSEKAYDRVLNCHTFPHRVQYILKQLILN